jgi:predicted aconitase
MVLPINADDAFWPLVGYLAGKASPDRIPLLRGLAQATPSTDDLKALCAAFGTTSAAPMLHIDGVTPEAGGAIAPDADQVHVTLDDFAAIWDALNGGPEDVQLVAIGSPHASLKECHELANGMNDRRRYSGTKVIVTAGNEIITQAKIDGTFARLHACGVQLVSDLCWCSISEPVFPVATRTVITNSVKYAHYGPGLSGRKIRFANLADCITAALEGRVVPRRPTWLTGIDDAQ